jgi:hypothetical protein
MNHSQRAKLISKLYVEAVALRVYVYHISDHFKCIKGSSNLVWNGSNLNHSTVIIGTNKNADCGQG